MGRKLLIIFIIAGSFFLISCGSAHVFSNARGLTKNQVIAKFGYPIETQKRSDGGETWKYVEQMRRSTQVIYYIINSDGYVVDKKITYD